MGTNALNRLSTALKQSCALRLGLLAALCLASVIPCCSRVWPLPFPRQSQQNSSVPAEAHGKKLIMKDGSFQIVSGYEVKGDRVRYFSVERSDWEEIPASLVDWPATKQAEASQLKADATLTSKLKADEAAASTANVRVDESYEVSPGVFLPPGDGFFMLDGRSVFPLRQSAASAKLAKGHLVEQILVPVPVVPSRTSVDLPGKHAAFRTTDVSPEFYLRTTDLDEPQVQLIMARVRGNKRHIENIDTSFGEQEHNGKAISLQEWRVAAGLYRFTLGQPLTPGEYALAQFSPKEGLNLLLWDFGVDGKHKESKNTK